MIFQGLHLMVWRLLGPELYNATRNENRSHLIKRGCDFERSRGSAPKLNAFDAFIVARRVPRLVAMILCKTTSTHAKGGAAPKLNAFAAFIIGPHACGVNHTHSDASHRAQVPCSHLCAANEQVWTCGLDSVQQSQSKKTRETHRTTVFSAFTSARRFTFEVQWLLQ